MQKSVFTVAQHCSWLLPPTNLVLSGDQVHLWRASLEQPATRLHELAQILTHDERARAGHFRFERDRRRFIVGRGMFRSILGRYLGIDPFRVRFRYGPCGKPYLAEEPSHRSLCFNLAHSHELALCAVTSGREIGVDLEHIRPMPDIEQIAARFCSAAENAALRAAPQDQKLAAFFTCWTRKEACLKALGDGLNRPLDRFDVAVTLGESTRLLRVEGHPQEIARWSLRTLTPARGYVATVVVEGHDWEMKYWQWSSNSDFGAQSS
jgi:4'-phosphopantetheinyl transferase